MDLRRRVTAALRRDLLGRPPLAPQLVLLGVLLTCYDMVRNLAPGRIGLAVANAREVLAAEHAVHIDLERALNGWLSRHAWLAASAGTYYDVAHYAVTIPLLVFAYWRLPVHYRQLRNAFVAMNALGLVVFWLVPLAPPRLLPGYTDTVATTHALGGWGTSLYHAADQYAAMPSLHVGWALWCALLVWTATPHRGARAAALAYPLFTTGVVVATANHYLLDAVAGVACVAVAVGGPALLAGLRARRAVERLIAIPLTAERDEPAPRATGLRMPGATGSAR